MESRRLSHVFLLALLLACSPDSDQITFGISAMSFANSEWSEPVNLGPLINSTANETGPALSQDRLSLYFNSARPGGLGLTDVWVSHRASVDSPWEAPVNLGATVNSPANDNLPILSHDGHLLFVAANLPGGQGSLDIYVFHRTDTQDDFAWGPRVALGLDVNTAAFEAAPSYMPTAEAGQANLYFSRGPAGTDLDIFSVAIDNDGETLGPAQLVGISAPSPSSDAHPSLRVDGKEVFFYSTRPGGGGAQDLWVATRPNTHSAWSTPVNLGAPINTTGNDIHPTLSFDGRTLIWGSDRPGSLGGTDLWMSTRTPSGH